MIKKNTTTNHNQKNKNQHTKYSQEKFITTIPHHSTQAHNLENEIRNLWNFRWKFRQSWEISKNLSTINSTREKIEIKNAFSYENFTKNNILRIIFKTEKYFHVNLKSKYFKKLNHWIYNFQRSDTNFKNF